MEKEVSGQHLACWIRRLFFSQSGVFVKISFRECFDAWICDLAQLKNVNNHTMLRNAPHVKFKCPEVVVWLFSDRKTVTCVEFKRDNYRCIQYTPILSSEKER